MSCQEKEEEAERRKRRAANFLTVSTHALSKSSLACKHFAGKLALESGRSLTSALGLLVNGTGGKQKSPALCDIR